MSPKSWQFNIEKSKELLLKSERLAHLSIELLKENRAISKVIFELHKSVIHLIKAFLYFEHEKNNLRISNEPKKDISLFFQKIAPRYLSKSQSETLLEVLKLAKTHKDAHLEISKNEKLVIFSKNNAKIITKNHLNSMMLVTKKAVYSFPLNHNI